SPSDAIVTWCTYCITHYPAHAALLSFPTRRSSDLQASSAARASPLSRKRAGSERNIASTSSLSAKRVKPARSFFTSASVSCEGSDRKSTRLNSSHVKISYAVFCLKKKKVRRQQTIA